VDQCISATIDFFFLQETAMGLKRMAGSLPLILLSFLLVVSAQPLGK
jgi:hypothetical protein